MRVIKMGTIFVLILLSAIAFCLFRYSDRLSKKEIANTQDTYFQPLIDELKTIDNLKFKTVSSEIIYSKTISAFLKVTGYLLSFAIAGLLLDVITKRNFSLYDSGDLLFYFGFYFVVSCIVFVLPLLSVIWNYTYFKYGVSDQIKNAAIIFEYLKPIPKKILNKYPVIFVLSYLAGRLWLDSGFIGVLAGTDLYGLGISIYFSLELKRLGLAPVLNLISEKTKLFQGTSYDRKS